MLPLLTLKAFIESSGLSIKHCWLHGKLMCSGQVRIERLSCRPSCHCVLCTVILSQDYLFIYCISGPEALKRGVGLQTGIEKGGKSLIQILRRLIK